ncbi:hypothetical protein J8273_5583 [Carpediemonas membranifera]|uniref:Uncharacterized protein n=1 Tax=Carpediemonas membranifera TaxID=201153 RepID=A0A8J6B2Q4_9EUKA|nr:hypothetical protein J8273_5583 [Carpediemonas membranifera]|eukprot:KAG9392989.1 hypothetical protein J8273_5583 [Carpediemonas membranifera]
MNATKQSEWAYFLVKTWENKADDLQRAATRYLAADRRTAVPTAPRSTAAPPRPTQTAQRRQTQRPLTIGRDATGPIVRPDLAGMVGRSSIPGEAQALFANRLENLCKNAVNSQGVEQQKAMKQLAELALALVKKRGGRKRRKRTVSERLRAGLDPSLLPA